MNPKESQLQNRITAACLYEEDLKKFKPDLDAEGIFDKCDEFAATFRELRGSGQLSSVALNKLRFKGKQIGLTEETLQLLIDVLEGNRIPSAPRIDEFPSRPSPQERFHENVVVSGGELSSDKNMQKEETSKEKLGTPSKKTGNHAFKDGILAFRNYAKGDKGVSLVIIVPAIVFLVVGLIAFFFYNSFDVVENMRGRMGNYHMNEVNRTSYSILLFLGRIGYAICVGFAWAMSAFCLFSIINEPVRRDFSLRFKGTLVVGILYVPLFYVGWYMLRDAETPFVRALSSLWIPLLVLVVAFVFFLLCEKLKWLSDMLKSFFSKSVKKK